MTELEAETIAGHSWHLSPMRVEQVGNVAATMRKYGASFEEIGAATMKHFRTKDDRDLGTTVFTFASGREIEEGVIVVTENNEVGEHITPEWSDLFATVKLYGLPEHSLVDRLVEDEMLRRGIDNYDIQRGEQ